VVVQVGKDKSEQKALDDIREYGLHIIMVGEDDKGPGFAYSIGLFENYAHPEVIIIGLKPELSHRLLNNMAYDIKEGKTFSTGEFHEDILDDFLCYFGDVPQNKYRDYVGWACWYYEGDDFPLIQCVYPTVKGIFPWEANFPEDARWFCEMLCEPPREH
jgi:hypothetical protein